jgi:hypothetical protein
MRNYCEEIVKEREQKTWIDKMIYQYPIGIETNQDLPKYLSDRLKDCNISLKLRFDSTSVMIDFNIFFTQVLFKNESMITVVSRNICALHYTTRTIIANRFRKRC